MNLTEGQKQTIATTVRAEPTLASAVANRLDDTIRDWLNADHSPTFTVYRSSISRHEILTGTSPSATTFQWAGGAYITRSQGERDAFREMFNSTGTVNPGLPSIIAAFNDIFSGAGGQPNRDHIAAISKRNASRLEKLFATGTGSVAVPGQLVAEGPIVTNEVSAILNVY